MSTTSTVLSNPDENRGTQIIVAVTTVTSLALITVGARIFTRLRMVHMFGADDWVIISAMVLSIVGLGLVAGQVMNGAGQHVGDIAPATNTYGLKLNFISQPIYLWAIPLVKISVGIFLLRITPSKVYRTILVSVMTFLMLYTMMCFITILIQCKNISFLWDFSVKTTCWTTETLLGLSYANSCVNIITDLFFAIIPVPMLWNIQINPRTKASLICVLGLGIFASAAAIVKATFIPNYGKTGDFLWDSANLTIWIATELNTGIIAACLPTLKPLFKRVLGSTMHYLTDSDKKYGSSYQMRPYGTGTGTGKGSTRPGKHPYSKTGDDSAMLTRGASSASHYGRKVAVVAGGSSAAEVAAADGSGSSHPHPHPFHHHKHGLSHSSAYSSNNPSEESIVSGGITKTTVVTVVDSVTPDDHHHHDGGQQRRASWMRKKGSADVERGARDKFY